jgi:hypothetical protein
MAFRVGIDFDNTIVCYDDLFKRVALEQGLIPDDLPPNKGAVRDYLRAVGKEPLWTEMQGYVYGERMIDAAAFPGALEAIARLVKQRIPVFIVSHKTRHPYLGPKYDLHESARAWLEKNAFFDSHGIGMSRDQVFFELTKDAKLARIGELNCSHFIDDLPELLSEREFPSRVVRLLFDPNNAHPDGPEFARLLSWGQFPELLRV